MARRALRPADEVEDSTVAATDPQRVRHLAFTRVAVAVVILLLQLMRTVLIPFFLGALLFYALDPAVDWMERWRVPRAIGAALMLLLVVSACGGLVSRSRAKR
jgi:predicted PurR-regulated permease PerM